ncbi:Agamous-like MADS-box protein AGL62 [Raphanus sativus]|nr:Agamous-like MADS-box protein AGL62 [Raphanus sativus]
MQLDENPANPPIQDMNDALTAVMNELELEQKKAEDLKKIRENSKIPEIWLKESIGGLDLGQAKEFKGKLEILKEQLTHEAFEILQGRYPHPSFYVGTSSNSPFGVDGGINVNPNMNMFDQRRMLNGNNFYNHNMALPNHPSPFGNYSHVPGYNYLPEPNQNENQNPSSKEENEAGNEHHHDGHPPHPRSD